MSFERWEEVANDYEKLFENEKGYDVIIYAGENESIKEIRAHSLILSTRSQYFCTELSKENIEKKDGKIIFRKPNISPKLFKIILRFIYCGKIDWAMMERHELLKLTVEVEKLNIHSFIVKIEEYLIKRQSELLYQNSVEILEIVYQHESFPNLQNFCIQEICEEPEILFNSGIFINLKPPLLELILKQDDLNLDEIDIWNSLLKWGLAQNPSISQDSTKWNKDEITIMKRTLHRFISLVRFYHMSPKDFLDKVYPLKGLLPEDLTNNVIDFHMAPNRKANTICVLHPPRKTKQKISDIIKLKHFAIFSSWIDRKENLHYNIMNTPYNFNLLYRASRDGNTAANFHAKCDNKGATIVVAKIENSEHILGGYNPLFWDSNNIYMTTNDSFIFSFTNRINLQTVKKGYSNGNNSICCYKYRGPSFGGGHDLSFQFNHAGTEYSVSNPCSYPEIDIPKGHKVYSYNAFDVEDYEVFQVIKKQFL